MTPQTLGTRFSRCLQWSVLLFATCYIPAQTAPPRYSTMAPPEQYRMPRQQEIALAQSAAPASISSEAEIKIMGQHGYETAIQGRNGFVCLVERSWNTGSDDPEFWNPSVRAPICYNPPGARTVLPIMLRKTELALAGRSKTQIIESIQSARRKGDWPFLEPGAMCYMMSRGAYLNDRDAHWHPHVMFFVPRTDPAAWGANLPHSPLIGLPSAPEDYITVFIIAVNNWSDGTPVSMPTH